MLSVGSFIVAGFAAGRAIEQPVLAEADVNLALAKTAILLAEAFLFHHFTLHADELLSGPSGAHAKNST